MALETYQKKRDFARTPEPKGEKAAKKRDRVFVIQKHAASRLHYDFRLALDGVLKSWAVPKGPSLDPGEKRLAVEVEDHPLEYGSFEGIIPAGQYGGGTVLLWDRGQWEPVGDARAGYRKGHLKFELDGEKLHGGFALIRMKDRGDGDKNWLLIKEQDKYARPQSKYDVTQKAPLSVVSKRTIEQIAKAKDKVWESVAAETNGKKQRKQSANSKKRGEKLDLGNAERARKAAQPTSLKPQLATLTTSVPQGENWLHEIKFDGYRFLCVIRNGKARLITRNGKDWTSKFPAVAAAVAKVPVKQAVLDGELVVLKPDGTTDFQALQNSLKGHIKVPLTLYLFDMPHCEGYDLTRVPLIERKELLRQALEPVLAGPFPLRYSDHITGSGEKVFEQACQHGMEGLVSKKEDSPYEQKRSRHWLKTKCIKRQEFVVGGFTDPAGSRSAFGALLLGYYDADNLIYCGRVGTGFNEMSLRQIHKELTRRERKTSPFVNPPVGADAKGVHWIAPELVAEVEFTSWTNENLLRHPSFQGLRDDKPPREIVREEPSVNPPDNSNGRTTKKKSATSKNGRATVAGVSISNPDRVVYPEQGLTKQMLAEYYESVADWILPYVIKRPLSIVRCPQGRQEKCFYQKHVTDAMPEAIRGIAIKEKAKKEEYIIIDDLAGLVSLVQIGALEIHPWGCREDKIERPDSLIFDLDPGPGTSWKDVIDGALLMRDRLEELGLRSFVKNSGGKGLHVVVPIARTIGWDDAKAFAKAVAFDVAKKEPSKYLATMSKAKRKGKIFIDYLRNGRGATSVAAYSTRAREGAPVSTPLRWNELSEKLGPDAFTVENIPQRLNRLKTDPWADYSKTKQSITKAMTDAIGAVR